MIKLESLSGKAIPNIGLGTYPFQGLEMVDIVKTAIKIGYRLFDTADDYRGESGIGLACLELEKEGICKREDLFIQTKISENASYSNEPLEGFYFSENSSFMKRHSIEEVVREKVTISLRELKTDYIDSLLIHLPYVPFIEEIWDAMIKLQKEGRIRYIGVSNFHPRHISMIEKNGILPTFNEIYISPIGVKQDQIDYAKKRNIQLMTYSPLMDIVSKRIPTESIKSIIKKYNKSLAQIVLRWNIERNCIPLPKSSSVKRLTENFDIFNFSLSKEEVDIISLLNKDYQYMPESKICPGL